MEIVAKRLKLLFIVGLFFGVVTSLLGLFLLIVTDDGSTTNPAIVCFSIATICLILSMFDLLRKPKNLIYIKNNQIMITLCSNVTFNDKKGLNLTSMYFCLVKEQVLDIFTKNEPEGGTKLFGALGYAATVKSANCLTIVMNGKRIILIKNIRDLNKTYNRLSQFLELSNR